MGLPVQTTTVPPLRNQKGSEGQRSDLPMAGVRRKKSEEEAERYSRHGGPSGFQRGQACL